MNDEFLTKEEVIQLTGWKNPKKQAEHLRVLGLAFFVNAKGLPVVPRSSISGHQQIKKEPLSIKWQPSI